MIARRQYMKLSAGTIEAAKPLRELAAMLPALTLLRGVE